MNDNLIPTHTVVDLDAWDRGPCSGTLSTTCAVS